MLNTYEPTFDAALQGASGRSFDPRDRGPRDAAGFAQAVAEESERTWPDRRKEFDAKFGDEINTHIKEYMRFFNDSIQGLAAGKDSVGDVVKKSHLMAMAALRAQTKKLERLDWLKVTLPHPTAPDCQTVPGGLPEGPNEHMLCATHGHVIDINTNQVIAHTVTEYDDMLKKGSHP